MPARILPSPLGRLALFLASVAAIYLLFRYAVLIPPAGWVTINVVAVAAFVLSARWARRQPTPRDTPPGRGETGLRLATAAAILIGLTLPLWIVLWFVWRGEALWR